MSKLNVWCCCVVAAIAAGSCQGKDDKSPVSERLEISSIYAAQPATIDGIIQPGEWISQDSIYVFDDSLRMETAISIRSQWDSTYLYLLFDVRDTNLLSVQAERDHPLLAKDDIIEFLLDTKDDHGECWNSDDIIYHINLAGQTKDDRGNDSCKSDARWNGEAKIAVTTYGTVNQPDDIDTGYVVEVAVPWKEIEQTPKPGLVLGANFGGQSDGYFYDWVDAWPFRQPFKFGKIILTKSNDGNN